MKILLKGNHTRLHAGSGAVWRRLVQLIDESSEHEIGTDQDWDCVIVNGEGSLRDLKSISKLIFAKTAKKLGKKSYLINTVWQNNKKCIHCKRGELHELYLSYFNKVCVRDVISYDEIKLIRPDAKIFTDLSYDLPIDILPSNNRNINGVGGFFHNPGIKVITELPEFNFKTIKLKHFSTWEDYLVKLRNVKHYVTGFHHEFIAACKMRVPFSAFRGNCDKVVGVIKRSGANIPVANTTDELKYNILTPPDQSEYNKLFNFLENQKPFTLRDIDL